MEKIGHVLDKVHLILAGLRPGLDWTFQAFLYLESVRDNHLQDFKMNTAPQQDDAEARRDLWWAYT
jgi:hypothetical protein